MDRQRTTPNAAPGDILDSEAEVSSRIEMLTLEIEELIDIHAKMQTQILEAKISHEREIAEMKGRLAAEKQKYRDDLQVQEENQNSEAKEFQEESLSQMAKMYQNGKSLISVTPVNLKKTISLLENTEKAIDYEEKLHKNELENMISSLTPKAEDGDEKQMNYALLQQEIESINQKTKESKFRNESFIDDLENMSESNKISHQKTVTHLMNENKKRELEQERHISIVMNLLENERKYSEAQLAMLNANIQSIKEVKANFTKDCEKRVHDAINEIKSAEASLENAQSTDSTITSHLHDKSMSTIDDQISLDNLKREEEALMNEIESIKESNQKAFVLLQE